MAPTRPGNTGAKRKRGRPSNASKTAAELTSQVRKRDRKPKASKQKPKGPSSSNTGTRDDATAQVRPSKGRKQKADDANSDEIADAKPAPNTLRLVPRKKRISQVAIQRNWVEVSPQVREQIIAVLHRAMTEVVNESRNKRRHDDAIVTLEMVIKDLKQTLPAMKMPPGAKDLHFNEEWLTARNSRLGAELTTERHAHRLLEDQVNTAKAHLENEQGELRTLKKDAASWKGMQKQTRKLHPLLDLAKKSKIDGDGPEDIGLKKFAPIDTDVLDAPDADLAPVLDQLRRSLESIQGNRMQVEGISEAMQDAEAALDDVLFKHATAQQYDVL
ncbi:CENP-Q, a CENPA-CAD centromere complex subunit-domain-containing protein [Clohesyomyces aquaticus]|uniref:CENP-Q, a CENPA-CAD centromere complex subunit-domain-containing protein n=1 Tax=Clohesyomyces aquaticus TaxID=1231657 RepID=A0A1Y1ZN33_9PLEO|nr:CENP-Q, a CENPA-CAD centromere complex subunit-domain-containing protein [Clohesyomyces aquaticus]